jgi:hypothetical protein
VSATACSLEGVREARMRRAGECAAMFVANDSPRLLGETPVIRTGSMC